MDQNIKYTLYRTKRKSLLLKLKSDGTLALYCPKGYPKGKAMEFLKKNLPKMIRLAKAQEEKHLLSLFSDLKAPSLLYLGKRYPVLFGDVKTLRFDGQSFTAPLGYSLKDVHLLYKELLRAEAKRLIVPLVRTLAEQNGLTFNRIFIKDVSSRYGSCSSKGNLNFSLALPAFDEEFIKYILLHELAHTVHFNHGSEFHSLLERICPSHRVTEARFKKYYSPVFRAICS